MKNHYFLALAIKILSGEGTPEEQDLHRHLLLNDEYQSIFKWYKTKWEQQATISDATFSFERALALLQMKIAEEDNKETKILKPHVPLRNFIWQIAASIIMLLSIGYFISGNWWHHQNQELSQLVTKTTNRGERMEYILPDGSKVYLNSSSKITFTDPFISHERRVILEGEAYFDVVSDKQHPFILQCGTISTTVLGTKFNVAHRSENVDVTLESGKVRIDMMNTKEVFYLAPGQQFSYDSESGEGIKMNVDPRYFTQWRKGILQFNEIPLKEALKLIGDWYDVDIECTSNGLLVKSIRGKYQNEELNAIMDDLQFMMDFSYELKNNRTLIINEK